jgi:NADH-quinone oxidoreductase subunit M
MNLLAQHLLSVLIWLPILGGLLLLIIGDDNDARSQKAGMMRTSALLITFTTFVLSTALYVGFDNAAMSMQFVERAAWVDAINAFYYLGIDGISAPLILLTTFITPLVIISSWDTIKSRPAQYFAAFLILEGLMIGVFCALDGLLFYVFWEAMLVPMFLIIGVWGGERRVYATIKFFLYTFLGSVLMLVAFIYLYGETGGFDLFGFMNVSLSLTAQKLIFLAFLAAFAVKVPMWPVHTWLPDAHVEAPTGGSVILAAVLLKMGGYGFVRFSLPVAPDASQLLAGLMITLSLIAVVYIGFVALVQNDMKKLIAYSSVAHMGFVTLGFFIAWGVIDQTDSVVGISMGITGGMVQMVSHGLISAALFLCVGVLYDRLHSRQISDYGGVINTMPVFAAFMVLFALANVGLPGTSGFVGEFLVILASFKASFWYAFIAATTLILSAAYTLWMVKRTIFGAVANEGVAALYDVNFRETLVLAAIAVFVLGLGLWPAPLIDLMSPTVDNLVAHITQSKL